MTGYGKAEALLGGGKLTVEFRTLNSKNTDISFKTSLLPKDKEMLLRTKVAAALQRGTIDCFMTWEANAAESAKKVNLELAGEYFKELKALRREICSPSTSIDTDARMDNDLLCAILRIPDVVDAKKTDIIDDDNWPIVEKAVDEAIAKVNEFRSQEGAVLYKDVTSRISNILALYDEVEGYEAERIVAVKERLTKNLEELQAKVDPLRFEQEMIYYLEKLDINEEKVRLRQHCKYFMDTIDNEPYPGKKLGFIIQEIGREINTTGSKSNHAGMQKAVVKMKDELEKMREQSLNIL